MNYKSALVKNMKVEEVVVQSHVPTISEVSTTYWDDVEEKYRPSTVWTEPDYYPEIVTVFKKLVTNKLFQRKFAMFAENMLCLQNTDTVKGLKLHSPSYDSIYERKGQFKEKVGFFMMYRQDGITYNIVYEHDGDINDARNGWFVQWFHLDECCGYSCDFFGCEGNYKPPKNYKKDMEVRRKEARTRAEEKVKIFLSKK